MNKDKCITFQAMGLSKFWLIWCKVFQDYIFGTVSKIKNGFDGGNIICWFIIAGHKCQDIVNCK